LATAAALVRALNGRQHRTPSERGKNLPCADSGLSFPYFIREFDHRDETAKDFTIAEAVPGMVGLARLLAELGKCDVVCCLCHRLRSARRAGWRQGGDLSAGKRIALSGLVHDT
jgi:hypothetical protein